MIATKAFSLALLLGLFGLSTLVAAERRQKNVYGNALEPCSFDPLTGWFRDGYCHTDRWDHGVHTVCATMTNEFLEYTKAQGNDLSSPTSYFPGLRAGDRWCLCALRWRQAMRAGKAPLVKMSATNRKALWYNRLQDLAQYDDNQN